MKDKKGDENYDKGKGKLEGFRFLGSRVQGSGSRVWGLGPGSGFRRNGDASVQAQRSVRSEARRI